MRRTQIDYILKDLKRKLVFIVGPRQVGKTWLAREIAKQYSYPEYLNYDHIEDRSIMLKESWPKRTDLLILDELHKMPDWKNYIKGLFDTKPDGLHILVTGSARLDTFRQTGDSLAGRFFAHRLLPFSLAELADTEYRNDIDRLLDRGGFPEPFLADDMLDAKRWRAQYIDGLIRTVILDFENINDFKAIIMVFELLRRRVGSPVSFVSIAEDVGISPTTVKKYINIFESLFIVFRVTPFSRNIARSLLKEPKIYFFDTALVLGDQGIQFENLVAVSLLKHVYALNDYEALPYELNYCRTKDGREVDFCLVNEGIIDKLIEVKSSDDKLHAGLKYFSDKYELSGVQVVHELRRQTQIGKIEIRRAVDFLTELKL